MVVAFDRPSHADDSWRIAGCGERCRLLFIRASGKPYMEKLVNHDPYHHEAYGESVLSRQFAYLSGQLVRTANLEINGATCAAYVDGRCVSLTPREHAMLFYLASKIGHVIPHAELLNAVWGPEYGVEQAVTVFSQRYCERHLIRTHLCRIRAKLGSARRLIETVTGRGTVLLNEPPVGAS